MVATLGRLGSGGVDEEVWAKAGEELLSATKSAKARDKRRDMIINTWMDNTFDCLQYSALKKTYVNIC